jgi:hypothetical protein
MWSLTARVVWQMVQEQMDNAQGLVSPSLSEGNLSVTVSRGLTVITEYYNNISGVYLKRVLYRGPWRSLYGWRISVVTCICIWEDPEAVYMDGGSLWLLVSVSGRTLKKSIWMEDLCGYLYLYLGGRWANCAPPYGTPNHSQIWYSLDLI